MNRFFVSPELCGGDAVELTGENLRHIRLSLRMKPGEEIVVCDGCENEYVCALEKITNDFALARIVDVRKSVAEPRQRIHLFFGLPKGDKTEFIIEKAVELGASEITPFISSRCISRPDGRSLEKKICRWRATAEAAAKQSGRGIIPQVNEVLYFDGALKSASACESVLLFYENAENKKIEKRHALSESVALFTGAEGGFSKDEVALATAAGAEVLTLGKRILRCETAPLTALSVLLHYEDD